MQLKHEKIMVAKFTFIKFLIVLNVTGDLDFINLKTNIINISK